MVQRLRICLPMQETGVQPLIRELRSHMPHLERPTHCQLLSLLSPEPAFGNKRSLCAAIRERLCIITMETQGSQKLKN